VLELARTEADLVACLAAPEALDAMQATKVVTTVRVAPDELLLIGALGSGPKVAAAAAKAIRAADDDALVTDVTDGWIVWTLGGSDAHDAFERLSMLHLPEAGVVQGDVARLPVKVVVDGQRLHLAVPSSWAAYLRERIVALALPVAEAAEPQPWTAPKGGTS
jgi:sarcosine oxidase gamma subunit